MILAPRSRGSEHRPGRLEPSLNSSISSPTQKTHTKLDKHQRERSELATTAGGRPKQGHSYHEAHGTIKVQSQVLKGSSLRFQYAANFLQCSQFTGSKRTARSTGNGKVHDACYFFPLHATLFLSTKVALGD